MRIIKVKRLLYFKPGSNEVIYGGEEYDGDLSDESILNSVHELGKTEWRFTAWDEPEELWLLKPYPKHPNAKRPVYRIGVDTFYRYENTWWDTLLTKIKNALLLQGVHCNQMFNI